MLFRSVRIHVERCDLLFSGQYAATDFFEGAALLVTFILFGKYLEARAKGLTSDAITKLMALAPDKAILVTRDEEGNVLSESEVDSRLVQRRDCLKVNISDHVFDVNEMIT